MNIVYWCFAQQDECSFVSLRDVDRALTVTSWFLQQAQDSGTLFDMLDEKLNPQREDDEDEAAGESLDSLRSQEEEEEEVGILWMAIVMDNSSLMPSQPWWLHQGNGNCRMSNVLVIYCSGPVLMMPYAESRVFVMGSAAVVNTFSPAFHGHV